jgi:hypothetical protein
MAGDLDTKRSTYMTVSGRKSASVRDFNNSSVVDHQAADGLSDAFRLLSAQLSNLNALMLNGVPIIVNTAAPIVNVEPPVIHNHVTVEPPVNNVQAPVVRIHNENPVPRVENIVTLPSAYFSKDEVWALVAVAMVMLVTMCIGLVMIGVKLWSQ